MRRFGSLTTPRFTSTGMRTRAVEMYEAVVRWMRLTTTTTTTLE
jgi:hypothetical protein